MIDLHKTTLYYICIKHQISVTLFYKTEQSNKAVSNRNILLKKRSHYLLIFEYSSLRRNQSFKRNVEYKTVLLRERKRHTARRVASTRWEGRYPPPG